MNSHHIVHSRGRGVEVKIPRNANVGIWRALESQFLFENSLFEVPILGARMRGLPRELAFFMIFRLRPSAPTSIVSTHELLGGGGTF